MNETSVQENILDVNVKASRVEVYDNRLESLSNGNIVTLTPLKNFTPGSSYIILGEKYARGVSQQHPKKDQYFVTNDLGQSEWVPAVYFSAKAPELRWNSNSMDDIGHDIIDIRKAAKNISKEVKAECVNALKITNDIDQSFRLKFGHGMDDVSDVLYENYLAGTLTKDEVKAGSVKTPLDKRLNKLRKQCIKMAQELEGIIMMINVLSNHRREF